MANARDIALAETINNDRFPIEVDITEDVTDGVIDREDLAEAMGGKVELVRLKKDMREARTALDAAKAKESETKTQLKARTDFLRKQKRSP